MDDVRAVLDAVGSSSAVLLGAHDGCSMAAFYAATYPERTRALVLFHPVAHDPEAQTEETRKELGQLRETWGTQELADEILEEGSPSLASDPEFREWFTNWLRVGASPSVAYALNRAWFETDLREVLPPIRVPTLVLYRDVHSEPARDVADRIPGAQGDPRLGHRLPRDLALGGDSRGGRAVRRGRAGRRGSRTRCSRPCSSPTSSARPRGRPSSATGLGGSCSSAITRSCAASSRATAARRRTPPATGSSRPSTGPLARSAARSAIVDERPASSASRCAAGVHTGECEVHEGKVAGLAVVIGARVAAARGRRRGARLADGEGPCGRRGHRVRGARRARAEGRARLVAALLRGFLDFEAVEDALIVDAVRSPIGRRNGTLASLRADELAGQVLNALVERNGLDPAEVEDVQMGCVSQVGEQGWNIGRMAPLVAGWPDTVPGTTVDRQCGSSMQCNFNAAAAVWSGQLDARRRRRRRVDVARADGLERRRPLAEAARALGDRPAGHLGGADRRGVGALARGARRVLVRVAPARAGRDRGGPLRARGRAGRGLEPARGRRSSASTRRRGATRRSRRWRR